MSCFHVRASAPRPSGCVLTQQVFSIRYFQNITLKLVCTPRFHISVYTTKPFPVSRLKKTMDYGY